MEKAIYLDSFPNEKSVITAINMIEQEKNNLVTQCQNKSTVEKIRIVHDYLVDTTEYDLKLEKIFIMFMEH